MTNKEKFLEEYENQLRNYHSKGEYYWNITELSAIAKKIVQGLANGTANKDGKAIKATCKALGINYTYKAIEEYLNVQ